MATLLQTLIIETLPEDTDSILRSFIDTLLPAIEREFAFTYAMGGDEADHYRRLVPRLGELKAKEVAQSRASKPDQSLLVHVLNALLTAWNLSKYLPQHLQLTEIEKRLLCLGMTLHDYGKHLYGQDEEVPHAYQVPEILAVCEKLGDVLGFQNFWADWKEYLLEIAYLAQNTQFNVGSNAIPANWESDEEEFTLDDRRLDCPLRHLLAFGDVAVHMNDPADVVTTTKGDRLRDHLDFLGISKKLVYHRLRDCRGLLTNQIHNAVVSFAREINWEPILYFAQGTVYLAPQQTISLELEALQKAIWQSIVQGNEDTNQQGLAVYFSSGDIGFVRDGKGLKLAPQTLELFSPAELIRQLPDVVKAKVANIKTLVTPKRLDRLPLDLAEKERLTQSSSIWADRLAEFIFLVQKEFFVDCIEYVPKVLDLLDLQQKFLPEQTAIQAGGVNYGWYHVASHYVADHATLTDEQFLNFFLDLADRLATWAEDNDLLKQQSSPTHEAFVSYLNQYLEVSEISNLATVFQDELAAYVKTKVINRPICSLSSGEAVAEDQLDSVVLFKPQQYSNKNILGGRRIKRGISKIWSLEMLLRQAYWSAPPGKLEEQQPVFLYIFPAYVYSPQVALAIRRLVKEFKRVTLWEVSKQWRKAQMQLDELQAFHGKRQDLTVDSGFETRSSRLKLIAGLQNLPWRDDEEAKSGRFGESYSIKDLPFMAMIYTTTRDKTASDAWVMPAFLTLALPILLGVKVIASSSSDPLYGSDQEFSDSAILDGAASFWNLLGLSASLRLQDLSPTMERLLIAYTIHLECAGAPRDPRWRSFPNTVREMTTNVLNIFRLADSHFREAKRDPSADDAQRYWHYSQLWSQGDTLMENQLNLTKRLVQEYRSFYRVNLSESSHAILLPLSKALEDILSVPSDLPLEDLILQTSGRLHDALERQKIYNRPLLLDKSIAFETRKENELQAIHRFVKTCVDELFEKQYKGDRALLQENRNRIKSGAEFAYRWLTLQDKQTQAEPDQTETEI